MGMNDREKVINLLSKYINCSFGDKDEMVTVEEIVALLKAQEPMKPIRDINGVYYCGNCDTICVGYEVEFTHSIIKVENYCHKCGRKVKWE